MRVVLATALLWVATAQPADAFVGRVITGLLQKAQQLSENCGSKIVSGFRKNAVVAGTRRSSLHASGHAIDVQGNPVCIYRMLDGWPGGYSVDYSRVNHVHISLNGREDGRRFAHHVGRRHARHRQYRRA